METVVLKAQKRDAAGRRAAGRVRRNGLVPAIIYGHGLPPVAIAVEREALADQLHRGAHLVDIELDGRVDKLLVKDSQYDHLGETLIHVDLARVRMDERVKVTVPLKFRGEPVGVRQEGGQLLTPLTQVNIECLVIAIPEEIRVNVAELNMGEMLTIGKLLVPEGVKVLDNPELVIAQVREPEKELEPVAAEAEGPAEPELIRPAKAEEAEAAEGEKPAGRTERSASKPEKKAE